MQPTFKRGEKVKMEYNNTYCIILCSGEKHEDRDMFYGTVIESNNNEDFVGDFTDWYKPLFSLYTDPVTI